MALLAIAGCGGASASEGPRTPPGAAPTASGLVVVQEGETLRTRWVDRADGRVLADLEGALFAEDGALYRWTVESVEVPLWDELPDEESPDPQTADRRGELLRAGFVSLTDDRRIEIVSAEPSLVARDVSHAVRLEAVVDGWAFVTEELGLDAFGAHGATHAEQHVVSLRGEPGAFDAPPGEAQATAEGTARLAAMAAERDLGEDVEDVQRVALHPSWTSRGALMSARLAIDTCYACGDGTWGDYRRSVVVEMPTPLRGPAPEWARSAPGERLVGFSEVDSETIERALASAAPSGDGPNAP